MVYSPNFHNLTFLTFCSWFKWEALNAHILLNWPNALFLHGTLLLHTAGVDPFLAVSILFRH